MFLLLVFLVAVLPVNTEGGEIIWGTESKPHSRPYMAYIKFYDSELVRKKCGGFLVGEDIVMTAAHCYGSGTNVTLGAHNIQDRKNTQVIRVRKYKRHEDFNSETLVNDIMILKLVHKAQLNSVVKTIALPKAHDWVKPGQVCTVAGWGTLPNCTSPNTLQEVNLEVQSSQKCFDRSKSYNDSIQLCVGNPNERKATSNGDSGGPLVCNGVAHGIVSYHFCPWTPPRVFTRISSFIPWIQKTMKLLKQP
ncbi:mast cell protease 8-like [Arvicanthis niloticus]|uniref:mast cell protease 8-like n=1 Tax=Arvicanthis niloticus TaxID=61156 RepID=UPI001486C97F|nr:granzyme-like protein 2 [Arvicanthis niloticus]